jgi:hypothetical protein
MPWSISAGCTPTLADPCELIADIKLAVLQLICGFIAPRHTGKCIRAVHELWVRRSAQHMLLLPLLLNHLLLVPEACYEPGTYAVCTCMHLHIPLCGCMLLPPLLLLLLGAHLLPVPAGLQ